MSMYYNVLIVKNLRTQNSLYLPNRIPQSHGTRQEVRGEFIRSGISQLFSIIWMLFLVTSSHRIVWYYVTFIIWVIWFLVGRIIFYFLSCHIYYFLSCRIVKLFHAMSRHKWCVVSRHITFYESLSAYLVVNDVKLYCFSCERSYPVVVSCRMSYRLSCDVIPSSFSFIWWHLEVCISCHIL
jgi:hypothetical protein